MFGDIEPKCEGASILDGQFEGEGDDYAAAWAVLEHIDYLLPIGHADENGRDVDLCPPAVTYHHNGIRILLSIVHNEGQFASFFLHVEGFLGEGAVVSLD